MVMQRILVGTDGSASGGAAVEWAADLASATGAELLVARAWAPMQAEIVSADYYAELQREALRMLDEEWCAEVRRREQPYRAILLEGDPRSLLLESARDNGADLLVVGARGTGSHPHALHLGSVAHHLAHHTMQPLALVPATARRASGQRILIGVDGSPGSDEAILWCRELAAALDAQVVAVHAERPLAEWVSRDDPDSWYQHALAQCDSWVAPLRDAGIPTDIEVVEREPVAALTEAGVRNQVGLLVVGTRGIGGVTGLRLGSTALKLLHHSGLPVVLVPPAQAPAAP
jgi:nucleotide-binding universal stress UspA family protein